MLIEQLDGDLESKLNSAMGFLETKKLREDVSSALKSLHATIASFRERFSEIKRSLEPYCDAFDREAIVPYMNAIGDLDGGDMRYHCVDREGYSEIEVSTGKLTSYIFGYLYILDRYTKHAYLENPEKLNPQAIERFEAIWKFGMFHELGGMSHPPIGVMCNPYGRFGPNEVLLELPTSDLIGWIWGDCYSVVLTIARDDLNNGRLDNILVDITN